MTPAVVVLNGAASSGKTTVARHLQRRLAGTWLVLGVDDLVDALPEDAVAFGPGGTVEPGERFGRAELSWYAGLAAIARAGTGVIVDEVFLGGARSQQRLAGALDGLDVLWVGVHCDPDVAAARERGRPDRVEGMARRQAGVVHEGVRYDLVIDTSRTGAQACAGAIADRIGRTRA